MPDSNSSLDLVCVVLPIDVEAPQFLLLRLDQTFFILNTKIAVFYSRSIGPLLNTKDCRFPRDTEYFCDMARVMSVSFLL